MTDYKLWKENIYNSIKGISNFERQNILWLGKNPELASSFNEDINMLYDSFGFADDFWEENHLLNFNFSSDLTKQLKILKDMIDNYQEKSTDEEVLKDPKWQKIVMYAKTVIDNWNK